MKSVKLPSTGWYIFTLLIFLGFLVFEVTRMSYAEWTPPTSAPPGGNPAVSTGGGGTVAVDECATGIFSKLSDKAFFEDTTVKGYKANNDLCGIGLHICTTEEILKTIRCTDLSTYPSDGIKAWISNGPPGSTGKINDCSGWNDGKDTTSRGAFWSFNKTTGGRGYVQQCTGTLLKFACCK